MSKMLDDDVEKYKKYYDEYIAQFNAVTATPGIEDDKSLVLSSIDGIG